MKRITYLLLLITMGSLPVVAQQKKVSPSPAKKVPVQEKKEPVQQKQSSQKGVNLEKFTMDIGPEVAIPFGKQKASVGGTGAGLSFHIAYPIVENIYAGINLGYARILAKGSKGKPANYSFVNAEVNYFVIEKAHIDAGVGYSSRTGTTGSNPFFPNGKDYRYNGVLFRVGAGYKILYSLDVSVRFEKASKKASFIFIRLAFRL